jgi:uncharacterized protein (TIGR02145 family)
MVNGKWFVSAAMVLAMGLPGCGPKEIEIEADGSFTDPRDSAVYHFVNIGLQSWMLENLNYPVDDGTGSWCYKNDPDNCSDYGRLYGWDAALKACPPGWHLPTDQEWKELERFLGMKPSEADSTGWRESGHTGIQIKATWDWNSGGTGENTSRFTALPSGFREPDGQFFYIGDITNFWTAGYTDENHAWGRGLIYYKTGIYRWKYQKGEAFSVRCIMNK